MSQNQQNQELTENEKKEQFDKHVKAVLSIMKGLPFDYVIMVFKTAITKAQSLAIIPD